MKLLTTNCANRLGRRGRHQDGMAVIVVIALLAIVLLYLAGNIRTLHNLGRELKLVEQRQLQRLAISPPASQTNTVSKPSPAQAPEP